jgi:hypothetical protein
MLRDIDLTEQSRFLSLLAFFMRAYSAVAPQLLSQRLSAKVLTHAKLQSPYCSYRRICATAQLPSRDHTKIAALAEKSGRHPYQQAGRPDRRPQSVRRRTGKPRISTPFHPSQARLCLPTLTRGSEDFVSGCCWMVPSRASFWQLLTTFDISIQFVGCWATTPIQEEFDFSAIYSGERPPRGIRAGSQDQHQGIGALRLHRLLRNRSCNIQVVGFAYDQLEQCHLWGDLSCPAAAIFWRTTEQESGL